MKTLCCLVEWALWELKEAVQEMEQSWERQELGRLVHEIIDGRVPIYTGELLEVALSNFRVATNYPECGPAFNGTDIPTNIIAGNIYEFIAEEVRQWVHEEELEKKGFVI